MYIIHNKTISDVVTDSYLSVDIYNIFSLLYHHGTFEFNVLENGLFSSFQSVITCRIYRLRIYMDT